MQRLIWIILGSCIFLFVTLVAVSTENTNYGKRVNFVHVNLAVRNSNSQIITQNVVSPSQVVTQNTTSYSTSANQNVSKVSTQTEYSSSTSKKSDSYVNKYKTENSKISYKNVDDTTLDSVLNNTTKVKSKKIEYGDPIPKYKNNNNNSYNDDDDPEYAYDNIDWSRWKSNFVNKILDDSIAVKELDKYPNGAFFYYSFIVDYEGNIVNVNVRSMYLSEQDKKIVSDFIKGYAHKPITRFPHKSNRKTAKVSAIMMLSNSETIHSKPSDFNDTERVKYQIK